MDSSLLSVYLTIVGIWTVTVISPGPNFVATCHAAVTGSRRAGGQVVIGISLGTLIWAGASLLGLSLLFQSAGWLYQTVRLIGALYLVLVGLQMLWSARRPVPSGGGAHSTAGWAAVRRGLWTDLSNPKAAAFFTSLFAVALPPDAPLWFDAVVISSVVAIAWLWYALVALVMSSSPAANLYRRASRVISAVAGALFVGFGLRLAAER